MSNVTLTRLETGATSDPDERTVELLSQALGYPAGFFYGDDCDQLEKEEVSFRSLSTITSRQRDAALAAGAIAFMLADWVGERFNLPNSDLLDLRGEGPQNAAAALRSYWGVGFRPIPHLIRLLEAKGVRVFSLSEQNKNVDAYSCWNRGVPYIFLNTFKSAERSRFDTAHELGHLVLHGHGVCGRDAEREADSFAAAFLMPREDLISSIRRQPTISYLIEAKIRWGVSLAALARNCADAGLITDWHYREMCKAMSIAGYRSKEPNSVPREESVLWRRVFEALWRDRVTKDRIARDLSLPIDEIQAILGATISWSHDLRAV